MCATFASSLTPFYSLVYYYIFDIKKCRKRSQVEEIKTYLGGLGISGEFTYPTAAQTAEELVDLGLSKKYSTIVAIGGEELATSIANRLLGRKEALGIIPLESPSPLSHLIGADSWKEAADALRHRRVTEMRLGLTAVGNPFLTSLTLDNKSPIEVTLEFKDFIFQVKVKDLTVANYAFGIAKRSEEFLDVIIHSADPQEGKLLHRLSNLVGNKKPQDNKLFSLLRARSLRIFTKTPLGLISDGNVIAKTPQLIESSDDSVRLITARKGAHFWE